MHYLEDRLVPLHCQLDVAKTSRKTVRCNSNYFNYLVSSRASEIVHILSCLEQYKVHCMEDEEIYYSVRVCIACLPLVCHDGIGPEAVRKE